MFQSIFSFCLIWFFLLGIFFCFKKKNKVVALTLENAQVKIFLIIFFLFVNKKKTSRWKVFNSKKVSLTLISIKKHRSPWGDQGFLLPPLSPLVFLLLGEQWWKKLSGQQHIFQLCSRLGVDFFLHSLTSLSHH